MMLLTAFVIGVLNIAIIMSCLSPHSAVTLSHTIQYYRQCCSNSRDISNSSSDTGSTDTTGSCADCGMCILCNERQLRLVEYHML